MPLCRETGEDMQAAVGVSFGMGALCIGIALVISELLAIRRSDARQVEMLNKLSQKKA
jgi:hypothetical protein